MMNIEAKILNKNNNKPNPKFKRSLSKRVYTMDAMMIQSPQIINVTYHINKLKNKKSNDHFHREARKSF